eukprot:1098101-Amphidinium_carterae.1
MLKHAFDASAGTFRQSFLYLPRFFAIAGHAHWIDPTPWRHASLCDLRLLNLNGRGMCVKMRGINRVIRIPGSFVGVFVARARAPQHA